MIKFRETVANTYDENESPFLHLNLMINTTI